MATSGGVEEIKDYKPYKWHKGKTPHREYDKPFYADEADLPKVLEHYKHIHAVHDQTGEYTLSIASKVKAGLKDFTGEKDPKAIAEKIRDLISDEFLEDYFKVDASESKKLQKYLTDSLLGPDTPLIRLLKRGGDRVSHAQIEQAVNSVMGNIRERLLEGTYTTLSESANKKIAQEVTGLMHQYLGGPTYEQDIASLEDHDEAREVVGELRNLDERVGQFFTQKRTRSPVKKEKK